MTVAVTGSMAFDYIMSFPGKFADYILPDQIEILSVSFLVDSMRRERGGNAGNIAYSMALLDQPCLLMATVGQDAPEYIAGLQERGVDTRGVLQLSTDFTASFFVSTDEKNNQIASFYTGAMAKANRISFHNQDYEVIDLAIISPNDPAAMVKYVEECRELKIPYIYDPSQQIPRLTPKNLVDGIDGAKILVVNDYEFEMVKKQTEFTSAQIQERVEVLIITQGEKGALIRTNDKEYDIPPTAPTRIADPTGVGDAFRSGLMTGMVRGYSWDVCGRLGSIAATYVLEQHGTQRHGYSRSQFADRYRDVYGDIEELEDFLAFQKPKL
ncbi:carbohydrate kinase family protein [Anaerolineales bacterium HSG6]|nr:carbohydrate kinase family protein [Anaerolineales bacterium HSG6]MDM8531074.1 carbohydrate kinase family protein [Anaerolineales bacterium HSG25]